MHRAKAKRQGVRTAYASLRSKVKPTASLGDDAVTAGDVSLNLSILAFVDHGYLGVSSYDAVTTGNVALDLSVGTLINSGFFGDDLFRVHGDESLGWHDC